MTPWADRPAGICLREKQSFALRLEWEERVRSRAELVLEGGVEYDRCLGWAPLVHSAAPPGVLAPLFALALLSGARAFAESTPGGGLELDLRDVPLVTAINMLIAQSGAEISFVDPEAKLENRKVVFLSIKPKSVEEALQKICRASGCYFEKEPGGEYVISPVPLTAPRTSQRGRGALDRGCVVDSADRATKSSLKIRLAVHGSHDGQGDAGELHSDLQEPGGPEQPQQSSQPE